MQESSALKTFCQEFQDNFSDWKPDESIFRGKKASLLKFNVQGSTHLQDSVGVFSIRLSKGDRHLCPVLLASF